MLYHHILKSDSMRLKSVMRRILAMTEERHSKAIFRLWVSALKDQQQKGSALSLDIKIVFPFPPPKMSEFK